MVRKELLSFCFLKNWTSAFNFSLWTMQLHFGSSQEMPSLYHLTQRQFQSDTQTLPHPRQYMWRQRPSRASPQLQIFQCHSRAPSLPQQKAQLLSPLGAAHVWVGGSQPIIDLVEPWDTPDGSAYETKAVRVIPGSSCPLVSIEPNWVIIDN